MMLSGHLLPFECTKCEVELIRILQPESDDLVVCSECRGVGSYIKVVHRGHKVISGALTEGQITTLVSQLAIEQ
jgi:hypothetical protein